MIKAECKKTLEALLNKERRWHIFSQSSKNKCTGEIHRMINARRNHREKNSQEAELGKGNVEEGR